MNQTWDQIEARLAIRQTIEDWAFHRDNGDFVRLRGLFSFKGRMTTNSASHAADEFITYISSLRERGYLSHHFIGASQIRLHKGKALAETQAQLMLRNSLKGIAVDNTVLVRYLDRFVKEEGIWRIEDRHPIYIKDRIDPVMPGDVIPFDKEIFDQCPKGGGQFLVYFSRANGAKPSPVAPITINTPDASAVYAAWENWLTT